MPSPRRERRREIEQSSDILGGGNAQMPSPRRERRREIEQSNEVSGGSQVASPRRRPIADEDTSALSPRRADPMRDIDTGAVSPRRQRRREMEAASSESPLAASPQLDSGHPSPRRRRNVPTDVPIQKEEGPVPTPRREVNQTQSNTAVSPSRDSPRIRARVQDATSPRGEPMSHNETSVKPDPPAPQRVISPPATPKKPPPPQPTTDPKSPLSSNHLNNITNSQSQPNESVVDNGYHSKYSKPLQTSNFSNSYKSPFPEKDLTRNCIEYRADYKSDKTNFTSPRGTPARGNPEVVRFWIFLSSSVIWLV